MEIMAAFRVRRLRHPASNHMAHAHWPDAGYRTSRPVMARPMIRRWISEVPSKMVKLSDVATCHQDLLYVRDCMPLTSCRADG